MDREITIERLFKIQEGCYVKNRVLVEKESLFIEDCITLIINRHIDKDGFTKAEEEKYIITRHFSDTALSSLINSYKLLLYGCAGDSLSLLRVSFEATVFQDYAVKYNAYDQVKNEVIIRAKGHNKFEFKEALKALEDREKTDRGRLHGFLSHLGSHLTAHRIKYNYYELDNKPYPVVSHAILEKKFLETIINIHMRVALYMINVSVECYQNIKPNAVLGDFFTQAKSLQKRYDQFSD